MGLFDFNKPKPKEKVKGYDKLYRVRVEPVEEEKQETNVVEVEQPKEKDQEDSFW